MRWSFPLYEVSQRTTALGVGSTDSIYFIWELQINTEKSYSPLLQLPSPLKKLFSISITSSPGSEEELIIQQWSDICMWLSKCKVFGVNLELWWILRRTQALEPLQVVFVAALLATYW